MESGPTLRVCMPDDTHPQGARCFNIHFNDDLKFQQAITMLHSSGSLQAWPKRSSQASFNQSSQGSPSRASSIFSNSDGESMSSETMPDDSEEDQIQQETLAFFEGTEEPIRNFDWGSSQNIAKSQTLSDRQYTLDLLEGKKKPIRTFSWGNAHPWYAANFNAFLRKEQDMFTWSRLSGVLQSQIPQGDFPVEEEDLEPTLLFLKPGSGDVYAREPLVGKSVTFFEALMMDVRARGWKDVLWLGRTGQELPRGVQLEGEGVVWGEGMI